MELTPEQNIQQTQKTSLKIHKTKICPCFLSYCNEIKVETRIKRTYRKFTEKKQRLSSTQVNVEQVTEEIKDILKFINKQNVDIKT